MDTENFRFYIKVHIALNIQPTIIHNELCTDFGDEAPSFRTGAKWSKYFRDGRKEINDETRITTTTFENIEEIQSIINDNPYITIEKLQEQTDLSHDTIQRIISDHLNLRKITARYVPKQLTDFQRFERVRICQENLAKFESDAWQLCDVVTGDEFWFYHKQISRKSSNFTWVARGDPPPTVIRQCVFSESIILHLF